MKIPLAAPRIFGHQCKTTFATVSALLGPRPILDLRLLLVWFRTSD
jgi:hypothetical protein